MMTIGAAITPYRDPQTEVLDQSLLGFNYVSYSGQKEFFSNKDLLLSQLKQFTYKSLSKGVPLTKAIMVRDERALNTLKKIKSFLGLSPGWHHGEGIPSKQQTAHRALHIGRLAISKRLSIDAVPGLNGEIQVAIYGHGSNKDRYLEITVEDDGSLNITRYDNRHTGWDITEDRNVGSLEEIESVIEEFGREIYQWRGMSEFYPKDIIMKNSGGFQVKPLRTTKAGYRLYMSYAFWTPGIQYVTT